MQIWITGWLLVLLAVGSAGAEQPGVPAGYGFLTGQVIMDGKPMPNATIAAFLVGSGPPPDQGSSRRVPEVLFRAEAGYFNMALPPGRYHIGVVSRLDPNEKGPPREDEKFFFVRDNKGELRQVEVLGDKTDDLGLIGGTAPESFPEITDAFTVEGTVYDEQGKPFSGALVLVRENLEVPRPLFISRRTGADGRYQLKLPAGQSYYLVVRENLVDMGRPVRGSQVGAYVGNLAPAATGAPILSGGDAITGTVGQVLKGVDITMRPIPNPEEIKESMQKKAQSPLPQEKGGEAPPPPLPGTP